ncbi:MAG: exodeoxyribonuclease VII large subunit [Gammaproteobacteria bacterium]
MPTDSAESLVPLDAEVWTVSRLNSRARAVLEDRFRSVWISGEISNMARPGSGHIYFSLKDECAEVRCAMFRGQNRKLRFQPGNGDQIVVRARVTVYEPRGSYQLIVEHMEPAGEGLLLRRLEDLKAKLQAEGLFDSGHKPELPRVPARIGVVTSPTGAAIRDILQILARRFSAIPVVIYPVQVQGERAPHDIAAALETATARNECDVLIVGRGGGSLEDLWAFNEELVARAIFDCPIPVVSAVGHEVDVTIADLVADLRAPTPSVAAELVAPDGEQWLRTLRAADRRLANHVERQFGHRRRELDQLASRISRRHPGLILQQHAQRLDELTQRIGKSVGRRLDMHRLTLGHATERLRKSAPVTLMEQRTQRLRQSQLRMASAVRRRLDATRGRLAVAAAGLDGVSPLRTLERGYAIVADADSGKVIRDADELRERQRVTGRLARGSFEAVVEKIGKN